MSGYQNISFMSAADIQVHFRPRNKRDEPWPDQTTSKEAF